MTGFVRQLKRRELDTASAFFRTSASLRYGNLPAGQVHVNRSGSQLKFWGGQRVGFLAWVFCTYRGRQSENRLAKRIVCDLGIATLGVEPVASVAAVQC